MLLARSSDTLWILLTCVDCERRPADRAWLALSFPSPVYTLFMFPAPACPLGRPPPTAVVLLSLGPPRPARGCLCVGGLVPVLLARRPSSPGALSMLFLAWLASSFLSLLDTLMFAPVRSPAERRGCLCASAAALGVVAGGRRVGAASTASRRMKESGRVRQMSAATARCGIVAQQFQALRSLSSKAAAQPACVQGQASSAQKTKIQY